MSKVTSKLQVTLPKAIADRYGIQPGDDIDWEPAGDSIRVVPARAAQADVQQRLRLFDAATRRIASGSRKPASRARTQVGRGWTREELYDRGRAR
jgi:AbrB family looped-hinge helix DNA binding protein